MIREDREMTAVKVQVEPFWARHNPTYKASLYISARSGCRVRSEFVTRRQSGAGFHYNGTQTVWRVVNRQFHRKPRVLV